jgi:hypothetical protein
MRDHVASGRYGTIALNGKTIKSCAYPVLLRGGRLLRGGTIRKDCDCFFLGDGYVVATDGRLAPLKLSNGGDFSARGSLIEAALDDIVKELKAR